MPFNSSDHDLVTADVIVTLRRHRPTEITVRSMRNLDQNALCLDLLLADWSKLHDDTTGADALWQSFLETWRPVIKKHVSLVIVKVRHPPCPWLEKDPDVRARMRECDLARADRDANRITQLRAVAAEGIFEWEGKPICKGP